MGTQFIVRLRVYLACIGLIIVSVLFTLLIAELLLQLTEVGAFSHQRRVLFYSQPSFDYSDSPMIRYHPYTDIRTVAVYGSHIDYDVTNRTNNAGFFDNVDYLTPTQSDQNVAFIGDSFTSGSGGNTPWVTTLRQLVTKSEVSLFSLGVSGTGFHNFAAVLDQYADKFALDQVNVMMITSDLYRSVWYPLSDPSGVRMCRNRISPNECRSRVSVTMAALPQQASDSDIIEMAQQHYTSASSDIKKPFRQRLRLFNLMCNALYKFTNGGPALRQQCPHLRVFDVRSGRKDILFDHSFKLLREMRQNHPEIRFRVFHIPEKGEVLRGRYAVNVVQEMSHLKLDYIPLLNACQWDIAHYHKHDGHFNDDGYAILAACMKPYVDE